MQIILASSNQHKANEIQTIIRPIHAIVIPSSYFNIQIPDEVEKYATYSENAKAKCNYIVSHLEANTTAVMADDSGLEVEALNGNPGIHSARYSVTGSDFDNRKKILQELDKVPFVQRKCKFVCSICLWMHEEFHFFKEEVQGFLLSSEKGNNGFGYDPIFYYPPYQNTFSMVSPEEKNKVSHRARAVRSMMNFISTKTKKKKK